MIERIDITATGVVDSIRNKMAVATITDNGLMPITSCDIEVPKDTISDANNIYSGWYYFSAPILNVPIKNSGFIYAHRLFKSSGISIQYCANYDNGELYIRTGKVNISTSFNSWFEWKKIYP